ncbi:DUF3108 domain-containing protein [Parapedobacter sp. ISTM3]|uniref:DUF3108 domain-containing protein n=1 Tax=Parapedobacter luteus TaxID=623280 RepID=A0A1T5DMW2_9SPHI|nr:MULTISPECIES: DUF3108 domain-containing protein [Parapedobacter]MBK1440933.1 DUF3108 domain-containing protein [Parapedobacter sp. ISTM3]SKB72955.1 Protein of unknown function [Parapedobacter luteus]
MKRTLAFICFCFGVALFANAQSLPYLKESAFKAGEELRYRLRYGVISAATGTLTVEDSKIKFSSPHSFHLSARGRTSNAFSIFYTVDNRYDSYIDSRTFLPHYYTENIREGNYRRTDIVRFDHRNRTVQGNKGTFKSESAQTFDLLSAYYFSRNLDLSNVKPGQSFTMTYFLNDEIATLGIEYVGIESVKTPLGTLECLKFSPEITPGRIFRKDSRLYLWVTNDGNRIPVKAQVEILIGSVTLELSEATGLKYPLGQKVQGVSK